MKQFIFAPIQPDIPKNTNPATVRFQAFAGSERMMRSYREADFRYDWLSTILTALEQGFIIIQKKGEAEEWFDGYWQQEHAESILGITVLSSSG